MNKPITEEEREAIEELLKHCPDEIYEALSDFRSTGNVDSFHLFLKGVMERFVEPEFAGNLGGEISSLKFVDDLGVDSLTMMEIAAPPEPISQATPHPVQWAMKF